MAKVRQPSFRLLLVWWAVATAAAGFGNPRAEVSVTRMAYALPAAAGLAAVAFDRALLPIAQLVRRPAVRDAVPGVALAALLIAVVYLNLHRFWYETPRVDASTHEAIVMRGVTSEECRSRRAAVVTPQPRGLLPLVFSAFQLDPYPLILAYDQVRSPSGSLSDGRWQGCIIVDPQSPQADAVVAKLGRLFPDKRSATLTDGTGTSFEIPIFY